MWYEMQNSLDFCCAQTSPGQIIKHEKKVLIALKKFWKFLDFIMNVKGSCEQKKSLFFVNSWKIIYRESHNDLNKRGCEWIQEYQKSKIDNEKNF